MNANGNVLVALSAGNPTPTSLVSLLAELDIQLPAERTGLVVDHFNYDAASAADTHDVLLLPPPGPLRPDVKDLFGAGAAKDQVLAFPRGVGAALGATELLTPILRAPRTAYSYNPKEQAEVVDDVFAAGEQLALVSAFQARNSARFSLVGSADMLQDKWFDVEASKVGGKTAAKTFNREFAKRVSGWTFNEIGVLRVNWIEHHLAEAGATNESNPSIYRVKNDVVSPAPDSIPTRTTRLTPPTEIHNLPLRIHLDGLGAPDPSPHRRPPARVLHALALPPPGAVPRRRPVVRHRGGLQRELQAAGPARHLQLQGQLQAPAAVQRRGEEHRLGAPHGARRVAAQLCH